MLNSGFQEKVDKTILKKKFPVENKEAIRV
jgi:hypothetical protein